MSEILKIAKQLMDKHARKPTPEDIRADCIIFSKKGASVKGIYDFYGDIIFDLFTCEEINEMLTQEDVDFLDGVEN